MSRWRCKIRISAYSLDEHAVRSGLSAEAHRSPAARGLGDTAHAKPQEILS